MIGDWLKNLSKTVEGVDDAAALDLDRITAHLLVEVARADYSVDGDELAGIVSAIGKASSLAEPEIREIVDLAAREVEENISYHQHVAFINNECTQAQKFALLENMWRVAYADQQLDKYEEAFIRRFADLIYLSHREFMQAKHKVLENLPQQGNS